MKDTTIVILILTNFGWRPIQKKITCLHTVELFSKYDSLRFYYACIGGNTNSTRRFRKYPNNGERTLLFDFQDKQHLLQSNENYFIQIVPYKGTTKLFVNGEQYFLFMDDEPLTVDYFDFRTVKSHQEIDNFKVYSLK